MNKAARMLVMSAMAATAALAFSAGPAAASSATPSTPAPAASKSTTQAADWHGPSSRVKVVGYFRGPISCHQAGRVGEWRNRWDSHACYRVPFGFKRGYWALQVRWDNHGGFPGQHHGHGGFPGQHQGPGFPGQGGPGFPGQHQGHGFPVKK